MTIKYIENPTSNWIPFPYTQTTDLNQAFVPYFDANGGFPHGPAPTRSNGAAVSAHEMRPYERFYWVEGELPQPPEMSDPKWKEVRIWLLSTINNGTHPIDPRLDDFSSQVWVDRAVDDTEKISSGAWSQDWLINYWSPPWAAACPLYRQVGWEPWANGHAGGSHYNSAMWALENYIRTQNPLAWQLFVLRVLHIAGQGMDWKNGKIRYEKSNWWPAGNFYPSGTWSHNWPECILFFWHLTGGLEDVATKVIESMRYSAPTWTGYWGTRNMGWYLRAIRAIDIIMPDEIKEDDVKADQVIDSVLSIPEQRGIQYFPNDGSWEHTVDVWQDWLFLSEAVQWSLHGKGGGSALYDRLKPFADHHLLYNRNPTNGQVAYYTKPYSGSGATPNYYSFTHTTMALPMMAAMVEKGDFPQAELRKSIDFMLNNLPNAQGYRGLLWLNSNDQQTRPWGPAACKIASMAMYGLRPDILIHSAGM